MVPAKCAGSEWMDAPCNCIPPYNAVLNQQDETCAFEETIQCPVVRCVDDSFLLKTLAGSTSCSALRVDSESQLSRFFVTEQQSYGHGENKFVDLQQASITMQQNSNKVQIILLGTLQNNTDKDIYRIEVENSPNYFAERDPSFETVVTSNGSPDQAWKNAKKNTEHIAYKWVSGENRMYMANLTAIYERKVW